MPHIDDAAVTRRHVVPWPVFRYRATALSTRSHPRRPSPDRHLNAVGRRESQALVAGARADRAIGCADRPAVRTQHQASADCGAEFPRALAARPPRDDRLECHRGMRRRGVRRQLPEPPSSAAAARGPPMVAVTVPGVARRPDAAPGLGSKAAAPRVRVRLTQIRSCFRNRRRAAARRAKSASARSSPGRVRRSWTVRPPSSARSQSRAQRPGRARQYRPERRFGRETDPAGILPQVEHYGSARPAYPPNPAAAARSQPCR